MSEFLCLKLFKLTHYLTHILPNFYDTFVTL
jgi:hypothetical protein